MLGKIDEIIDNSVIVNLDIDITEQPNLVNLHVVFEDGDNRVVGEIVNVNKKILKANIVGEIKDKFFSPGSSTKPSFKSKVRLVNMEELELLLGSQSVKQGQTNFGTSNIYKGYKINVPINDFFSNHFAVLGNSGAGKSCTVASIFQKLYTSSPTPPINSTLFFFDAYGEYTNAFGKLHEHNSALDYKVYTTNVYNPETRKWDATVPAHWSEGGLDSWREKRDKSGYVIPDPKERLRKFHETEEGQTRQAQKASKELEIIFGQLINLKDRLTEDFNSTAGSLDTFGKNMPALKYLKEAIGEYKNALACITVKSYNGKDYYVDPEGALEYVEQAKRSIRYAEKSLETGITYSSQW